MLYIDQQYAQEMVAHALEEDPNECCGILAGKGGQILKFYRITNSEASPYRYRMDPKELEAVNQEIKDSGMDIIAFYHSHTHSEAYPSATDIRTSKWPGSEDPAWPGVRYVLISLLDRENPPIRAFRIEYDTVTEEEVVLETPH